MQILGGPSDKDEVLNQFYNVVGAVEKQIQKAGGPLLILEKTYSVKLSN